jgi:hypothetical protein
VKQSGNDNLMDSFSLVRGSILMIGNKSPARNSINDTHFGSVLKTITSNKISPDIGKLVAEKRCQVSGRQHKIFLILYVMLYLFLLLYMYLKYVYYSKKKLSFYDHSFFFAAHLKLNLVFFGPI